MKKLALLTLIALIAAGCAPVEDSTTDAPEAAAIGGATAPVEAEPVVELFQPIPPDIEVPVTWDTLLERSNELSQIVYDDVYATIARNKQIPDYNDISYTVYRSPNLDEIHYADIDSWLDDLFALYANAVKPDKETYIAFPYEDLEWAVALLSDPKVDEPNYEVIMRNANQGPEQGVRQNFVPGMLPGTFEGIWVLPATLGPVPGSDYTSFAVHEESTVNHEYGHQVQQRQWKKDDLRPRFAGMGTDAPCFLIEGIVSIPELTLIFEAAEDFEANLPGRIRSAYLYDPESADQLGNFTRVIQLEDEVTVKFAEDYLRTSLEPQCEAGNQYALGYSLGYLATEGLAAIGGVESTMALFTRMGENDIPWEEAFAGIYGVTWDEALPILAELVSKRALEYRN